MAGAEQHLGTERPFSISTSDTYAGADIVNGRRFGALTYGAAVPLHVALLLFGDLDTAAAWVGALNILFCLFAAAWLLRSDRAGFRSMLVLAYAGAAMLSAMMYLAGGWAGPYDELYLGLIVNVALTHPARRALPFLLVAELLVLTPTLYGGTADRVTDMLVALGLWTAVAVLCSAVMSEVRRQRVALASRGDQAVDEARRDRLTDLENRRSFDETITDAIARARAERRPLSLALGDLDGFKAINDVHGHLAGDSVLVAVAQALRRGSRGGDRVFRWAGDEFAVILDGADAEAAAFICDRLAEEVSRTVADPAGGAVTITLGWTTDDGDAIADDLVARADAALLWRKRGPRETSRRRTA
jgi:diguanylate cyclase (GGDEF)-like protein